MVSLIRITSTIEVETIDLDTALVRENGIDWFSIDSEGNEVNVLKVATNTLGKHTLSELCNILG
jgi:hypothetical protein